MVDTVLYSAPDDFVPFDRKANPQTLHGRVELQSHLYPTRVAVRDGDDNVTYRDLNQAASRSAQRLLSRCKRSADPHRPVALFFDQGLESIVWTLAVLKSGRCFAPLDARLPEAVLTRMVAHLEPEVVVAAGAYRRLAGAVAPASVPVLIANDDGFDATSELSDRDFVSAFSVAASNPACVFYTSGSTGAPKAVLDSHGNILHNIQRYANSLAFAPSDRFSLIQNPSFSGTVSTLFGALCNGGTVVPIDLPTFGLDRLSAWIDTEAITLFHAVPSLFRRLSGSPARFASLRLIRLEGDRSQPDDIAHFTAQFSSRCVLVNGLGATETGLTRQHVIQHPESAEAHVDAAVNVVVDGVVPIGNPVSDMLVRIVDSDGSEVASGSIGEIEVESEFLALGYWHDAELTTQCFRGVKGKRRRYRTGDVGRMLPDGLLLHLGRIDDRVKIRGETVDPGEVEAHLAASRWFERVALRPWSDADGDVRLVACIVYGNRTVRSVDELRSWLMDRVGTVAIPAHFIECDDLPLTRDGKVDRLHLPVPSGQRPSLANRYVAPESNDERALVAIWQRVLGHDPIGITDSFFDLGGDSLGAMRLVAALDQRRFSDIGVVKLFATPTIRGLLANTVASDRDAHETMRVTPTAGEGIDWPEHAIAVIGAAVRTPDAETLDAFWQHLVTGRDATAAARDDPIAGLRRVELSDATGFDAGYFGLGSRAAEMLDPQHRLWLECAVHAFEHAGVVFGDEDVDVGVFCGTNDNSYLWQVLVDDRAAATALLRQADDESRLLKLGNDREAVATRTAHLLGLVGPCIAVNTACSTGLVAVAQACQALAVGQTRIALAGAASIRFPQGERFRPLANDIRSADGVCRAFDAAADGTVFGDGVGAVVLKRLRDAIDDGDTIHAVIRGWAVNNDGSGKASFAAPSAIGQARVVAAAHRHGEIDPDDIGYVEAHGTGTPIGDPIEVEGLTRAFRQRTSRTGFCGLGSIKSQVGHLDTAAGIVGLLKTVLSVRERRLPATLHVQRVNPAIELDSSPFYLVDRCTPWPNALPRAVAGVTSLGVGGTNCHVVVEGWTEKIAADNADSERPELLLLSAGNKAALRRRASETRDWLERADAGSWSDTARTSQRRQRVYPYRLAVPARSHRQAADALRRTLACWESNLFPDVMRGHADVETPPVIGFVYSGQGTPHGGFARALFESEPVFRDALQACAHCLAPFLEHDLPDILFAEKSETGERTDRAQPAIVAMQFALTELLAAWGIRPTVVLGHSLGEVGAALCAGILDIDTALPFVAERARLMQQGTAPGVMLAVAQDAACLQSRIDSSGDALSIAAINAPDSTVVAGDASAVAVLERTLHAESVGSCRLPVDRAYHSALMEPILGDLAKAAVCLTIRAPRIRYVSALLGRVVTDETTRPDYWVDHARHTVRYFEGLSRFRTIGCDTIVEIGTDAVLAPFARRLPTTKAINWVTTLRRDNDDRLALRSTLAALWTSGAMIDWPKVCDSQFRVAPLPGYPFEHRRYWYVPPARPEQAVLPERTAVTSDTCCHPLLGQRLRLPGSTDIRFEAIHSRHWPTFVDDHRLFDIPIIPGAAHFSMLLEAAAAIGRPLKFEQVVLHAPLTFSGTGQVLESGCSRDDDQDGRRIVQLVFTVPETTSSVLVDRWSVALFSAAHGHTGLDEMSHIGGNKTLDDVDTSFVKHLGARAVSQDAIAPSRMDFERFTQAGSTRLSRDEFYENIWANQGGTGAAFRWIEQIWIDGDEALCQAKCPVTIIDRRRYRLHPGAIESACQLLHACAPIETPASLTDSQMTYVPFSLASLMLLAEPPDRDEIWCHARLVSRRVDTVVADLKILDADGLVLAKIDGFCLRRLHGKSLASVAMLSVDPSAWKVTRDRSSPDNHVPRPVEVNHLLQRDASTLLDRIRDHCAAIIGCSSGEVDATVPLTTAGLDSLGAVALANRLESDTGTTVQIAVVLGADSLQALADALADSIADPTADSTPESMASTFDDSGADSVVNADIVSPGQQRLWFFAQQYPTSGAHLIPLQWRGHGSIDTAALDQALHRIVMRHRPLRTSYRHDGDRLHAMACCDDTPLLSVVSIEDTSSQAGIEAESLARVFFALPFDLTRDRTIRAQLIVGSDGSLILNVSVHHIAFDGWSTALLSNELSAAYRIARNPATIGVPMPAVADFQAYARRQVRWLSSDSAEASRKYWAVQLSGANPTPLSVSDIDSATAVDMASQSDLGKAQAGAELVEHRLSPALATRLRQFAREHRSTPFMVLLAGLKTILARYDGIADITIGSAVADRSSAEVESVIGYFVNILPLRTRLALDQGLSTAVASVRVTLITALEQQSLPFDQIVESVNPPREPNRNPLFRVMFNHQHPPCGPLALEGVELHAERLLSPESEVDLTLSSREVEGGILLQALINKAHVPVGRIGPMLGHLECLLEDALANPDKPLQALTLLPQRERRQLLDEFSGAAQFNEGRPLVRAADVILQRFDRHVTIRPDAIAVTGDNLSVSYSDLAARGQSIASALRDAGLRAGDTLALWLPRGEAAISTMLAALRIEVRWLPLEIDHPIDRLRQSIDQAGCRLIVFDGNDGLTPAISDTPQLDIGSLATRNPFTSEFLTRPVNADERHCTDGGLYMMNTSGTSGIPRLVDASARGLLNRIDWMQKTYPLSTDDAICHKTSLAFVDSVWEIFGPLTTGARIVIADRMHVHDPRALLSLMKTEGVTHLVATPSWLDAWSADIERLAFQQTSLRLLISSGETLSVSLGERLRELLPEGIILNLYGCTEVSGDATCLPVLTRRCLADAAVGWPISGARVYVLERNGQPCPIGVEGNIGLAGAVVANGYRDNVTDIESRFVADPFHSGWLFRTGDRGWFDSAGCLHLTGRCDDQIKIRGMRVDPSEIERIGEMHPGVDRCQVVTVRDTDGSRSMSLFYAAAAGTGLGPTTEGMREYLRSRLPRSLIPGAISAVGAIPTTSTGKIDRAALLADLDIVSTAVTVAPLPAELVAMLAVWSKVLGHERIGADDDFFDVGGHSLLGIKLLHQIEQHFGTKLPVAVMFESPTPRRLLSRLSSSEAPGNEYSAESLAKRTRQDLDKILQTVSTTGNSAPVMLFPPFGMTPMFFQALATALAGQCPVYIACNDSAWTATTVNEMTDGTVAAVQAKQPTGPLVLLGACYGALYAFDAARHLARAGRQVTLFVIDSHAPSDARRQAAPAVPRNWRYWPTVIFRKIATRGIRESLFRSHLRIRAWFDPATAYHIELWRRQLQLAREIRESQVDFDIVLIESEEFQADASRVVGWQRCTSGHVDQYVIPHSRHLEVNSARSPHWTLVARWIRQQRID